MDFTRFCVIALLTLAASAQAQQLHQWQRPDCGDLDADSFEAALLECDSRTAAGYRGLARTSIEEEVHLTRIEPSSGLSSGRNRSSDRSSHIEIEGNTVLVDLERPTSARAVADLAGTTRSEIVIVGAEVRELSHNESDQDEAVQILEIPNRHLPPPGSCRAWFPDRSLAQQPPPATCDVQTPEGAVLIRG